MRDAFVNCDILPEEALHNSRTGYMEADYGTYEYEKENGMEKEHIKF